MKAVLEFQNVSLNAEPPYEVGLRGLSFALAPGELLRVDVVAGRTVIPLADLAGGLLEPEEGEVLLNGRAWRDYAPDEAAVERGRIGRIFEGTGWISNLDVDENITLSARYHAHRSEAEALQEARELAVRLGLGELPAGRPVLHASTDLRRAEWVRALLGNPSLLILERPVRDLPSEWIPPLLAELDRRRAAGAAVIWIQKWPAPLAAEALKPTLHFEVESGNITRI